MLTTTALTTAIWLAVTLLTRPESEPTLQAFYDRVRPAALGWRTFARIAFAREMACHSDPEAQPNGEESPHFSRGATNSAPVANPQHDPTLAYNFFHWVLGFTLIYAMLFGLGDLLFGRLVHGCALIALSAACLGLLFWSLNRRGWSVWR
jgi:hypothetical protein